MQTKTENLPVTVKKQIFIGSKELVDAETGEIYPVQLKQVEDRDFNFHKIWLQLFIEGLDGIANKKMKLAFWIIEHLDKENKFVYTFRRIAEETGLSVFTVTETMKRLQEGEIPFLKKIQSGVYVINPDILYKGSHKSRMGVVYEFSATPSKSALEEKKEINS